MDTFGRSNFKKSILFFFAPPFPGCPSWYGQRHVKCPGSGDRCVRDLADCSGTDGSCSSDEFACRSGLCIPLELACDGAEQCDDGSDETVGCSELFPEEQCMSWHGQKFVECR